MLAVNEKFCTGCRICEQVCSMEHHGEYNPALSRVRIVSNWPEEKVIMCRQCKALACIKACPQTALSFNGSFVVLNEELCDGCGVCFKSCVFKFNLINVFNSQPLFCDTCSGKYLCVSWCPSKVIRKEGK